jgi:hypothetical protein
MNKHHSCLGEGKRREREREEVTKKRIQKALGNKEFVEKINTLQTVLRQRNP